MSRRTFNCASTDCMRRRGFSRRDRSLRSSSKAICVAFGFATERTIKESSTAESGQVARSALMISNPRSASTAQIRASSPRMSCVAMFISHSSAAGVSCTLTRAVRERGAGSTNVAWRTKTSASCAKMYTAAACSMRSITNGFDVSAIASRRRTASREFSSPSISSG